MIGIPMTAFFNHFDSTTLIGKVLRLPLKLIPKDHVTKICFGPNRGQLWVVGSSVHGCWIGSYEQKKAALIVRACEIIGAAGIALDVGANAGYYTLLFSRFFSKGKVHAFEPLPSNTASIKTCIKLNQLHNVKVNEVAVSDKAGTARFLVNLTNSMGGISEKGDLEVATLSLDEFVSSHDVQRVDLIKMDIEGGELSAIKGMSEIIKRHSKMVFFLATHSPEIHIECLKILKAAGFSVQSITDKSLAQTDEVIACRDIELLNKILA